MDKKKTSLTFKIFKKLGVIADADRYGNISLFGIIKHAFVMVWRYMAFKYCYSSMLLGSLNFKRIRPALYRSMGCHVGKNVRIGHSVAMDYGNTELLTIEDNVAISNNVILLCHKRDTSGYRKGMNSDSLPFLHEPITLKKGCQIGIGTMIMPGVTVGEGAIIGSRSLVTKDIPAWTIAIGSPAKVVKDLNLVEELSNSLTNNQLKKGGGKLVDFQHIACYYNLIAQCA